MQYSSFKIIKLVVCIAFNMALALPAHSIDKAPGSACATNGAIKVSSYNNRFHRLICDGGTWVSLSRHDSSGKMGGRTDGQKPLMDIAGEIKVGTSTGLACNTNTEGAIRYNDTTKKLDICNGTAWSVIENSCDDRPDGFTFGDEVNRSRESTSYSRIVEVTGISCAVDVTVSGAPDPEYRICSDSNCSSTIHTWRTGTQTIDDGQFLQLRNDSSDQYSTDTSMTVTVGSYSTSFTTTTKAGPPAHKKVFKVSTNNGNLGGVAGADTTCNNAASAAGLTGTFMAWVATDATNDPESRFTKYSDTPYYYTNGSRMAHNWIDLTDGDVNMVDVYASGNKFGTSVNEWTGVNGDGTAVDTGDPLVDNCNGWTSSSSSHSGHRYGTWWGTNASSSCNTNNLVIMCFEQ